MADHDRIWLSARCDLCDHEDRQWCCNNEWPDGCDPPDCTAIPTEYVRVDLAVTHAEMTAMMGELAGMEKLRARVAELEAALREIENNEWSGAQVPRGIAYAALKRASP